jgi:hypothetical protein
MITLNLVVNIQASMCGYKFTSDSDDSIKGKYVFSSDGSITGTAVSY